MCVTDRGLSSGLAPTRHLSRGTVKNHKQSQHAFVPADISHCNLHITRYKHFLLNTVTLNTSVCTVFLVTLVAVGLVKKFSVFYETQPIVNAFMQCRQEPLC
jgi:hypothetical protein